MQGARAVTAGERGVQINRASLRELRDLLRRFGILVVLGILCVVLTVLNPVFATVENLLNVARQSAIIALIGMGASVIFIQGGMDLSPGSVVALSGVVGAWCMVNGASVGLAALAGIGCGLVTGLINGLLIVKGSIPPFIVTLGSMAVARGLALIITRGTPISGLPQQLLFWGRGYVWVVPVPVIVVGAIALLLSYWCEHTRDGRYLYAIGGNQEACVLSGINVGRMRVFAYALAGLLAGISGMLTASRMGSGQATAGQGLEFEAITAAILGGVSLYGGAGKMWGPLVGALFLGTLANGMVLLGVSAYLQQVIRGIILVIAVLYM